jgi:hypothetical protein
MRQSTETGFQGPLMGQIYRHWHGPITAAISDSAVPASFVAALTANESGGDPAARAFEPGIFKELQAVLSGQEPRWGSLVAEDLRHAVATELEVQSGQSHAIQNSPVSGLSAQEEALRQLATSWGLTQIMGYHIIHRGRTIQDLLNPLTHYRLAVELLEEFGKRFRLDLSADAEALFRTWNTGRPDGKTADPAYALRGIQRMRIYTAIVRAHRPSIREDHAKSSPQ